MELENTIHELLREGARYKKSELYIESILKDMKKSTVWINNTKVLNHKCYVLPYSNETLSKREIRNIRKVSDNSSLALTQIKIRDMFGLDKYECKMIMTQYIFHLRKLYYSKKLSNE